MKRSASTPDFRYFFSEMYLFEEGIDILFGFENGDSIHW